MVTCFLCQKSFTNNLGGQLTIHLEEQHNLSLEDYVVLKEYDGISPKCACNLCDDRPVFSRGKFLTYAMFHQKHSERERRWIEKFGTPTCTFCKSESYFVRGEPKKYCSTSCAMKDGKGFSNPKVQEKICNVVLEKYGVSNVSKVQEIKEKLSQSIKGKTKGRKSSTETRQRISRSSKERWKDDSYRERVCDGIRQAILSNPEEIQRRKDWLKEKMRDPVFRENLFKSSRNRLTGLHQRLRIQLSLEQMGFVSEQQIGRYFVDELHMEKKIIVEIFGDYPHANPEKFDDHFVVRMVGQRYTAQEKHQSDEKRLNNLRDAGYKVIVVWESDNIDLKKHEIEEAVNITTNG